LDRCRGLKSAAAATERRRLCHHQDLQSTLFDFNTWWWHTIYRYIFSQSIDLFVILNLVNPRFFIFKPRYRSISHVNMYELPNKLAYFSGISTHQLLINLSDVDDVVRWDILEYKITNLSQKRTIRIILIYFVQLRHHQDITHLYLTLHINYSSILYIQACNLLIIQEENLTWISGKRSRQRQKVFTARLPQLVKRKIGTELRQSLGFSKFSSWLYTLSYLSAKRKLGILIPASEVAFII
jgi:hypothetical protein